MPASEHPSSALKAANARLARLRAAVRQSPKGEGGKYGLKEGSKKLANGTPEQMLPPHLGWGSEVVTAHLRQAQIRREKSKNCTQEAQWGKRHFISRSHNSDTNPPTTSKFKSHPATVKLYPDIGFGMLRQEFTASGRLWLLLRALDEKGTGKLRFSEIQPVLTEKHSPWRLCGGRQLRNLLREGRGVFWTRDKTHVWLRSAGKVAAALEVTRLTGRPVALPVTGLLGGIGDFRAHLYAAFHSGRTRESRHGVQVQPIARETLAGLSGVGRSSQRAYEARTGVDVQANFAVGETAAAEHLEQRAWRQGQALFELKDYRGQQGKKGKSYLAWQLPNSYTGCHSQAPKGRQKRINRELRDLVMKGMPGNGETAAETAWVAKRYYGNGKLAAQALNRQSGPLPEGMACYWRRGMTKYGRFGLWQGMGG